MNFVTAVRSCFGKYARFSGRSSRSEYWNFALFIVVVSVLLALVDKALFGEDVIIRINGVVFETNGPLVNIFGFVVLLPLVAAGWRRMHDTGRSGIYLLYPLIVMLGVSMFLGFLTGFAPLLSGELWEIVTGIWAVVAVAALFVLTISPMIVVWWLTRPSQSGENVFGPQPEVRNSV